MCVAHCEGDAGRALRPRGGQASGWKVKVLLLPELVVGRPAGLGLQASEGPLSLELLYKTVEWVEL